MAGIGFSAFGPLVQILVFVSVFAIRALRQNLGASLEPNEGVAFEIQTNLHFLDVQ